MNYGFEDKKFYIELDSCSRTRGTFRDEHELVAKRLAEENAKIFLCLSSGIDSQSILHSFHLLDYNIDCAFLYMPGYNDAELDRIKILEKKYNKKVHIIDFNLDSMQKEIEFESIKNDISLKLNVVQQKFVSALPNDVDIVQGAREVFVFINPVSNNPYFYQGYYNPGITRRRAFKSLKRAGRNIFWGDNPEFLLSILDDDVYKAAVYTAKYFDGNGATIPGKDLTKDDRWDYYIKPLIYGKYWKDELIYFPKSTSVERAEFLKGNVLARKHAVAIPYFELLEFLKNTDSQKKKFFENVTYEKT